MLAVHKDGDCVYSQTLEHRSTDLKAGSLRMGVAAVALAAAALVVWSVPAGAAQVSPPGGGTTLRVCADPNNLPQSNRQGLGYENQIAQALAHDLGLGLSYTFFPQRMGFVRNTLRARDETTRQFKCDVIMGVPSGYDLTATTRPYMHSTYAMVVSTRGSLAALHSPEDLLKLPEATRQHIHIGLFARTPGADWVLQNGLIDRAVFYPPQSGDPNVTAGSIIEQDLGSGHIDAAILWGPIAGFVVNRHSGPDTWKELPFATNPRIRFDYEISMGVRNGEPQWKDTLDHWISEHHADIDRILARYHVPLLPHG